MNLMNILEFDNYRSFSHNINPRKQKIELFYIKLFCNHAMVMTFISHIYRTVGPLGEKFDF